MSTTFPSRKLTYTVVVKECQSCPMLDKGIEHTRDDYCKLLKRFLWNENDDNDVLFPKDCPLPKE